MPGAVCAKYCVGYLIYSSKQAYEEVTIIIIIIIPFYTWRNRHN